MQWSLKQIEAILKMFGFHSALIGFEPVNEPWDKTPKNVLFDFYRKARKIV